MHSESALLAVLRVPDHAVFAIVSWPAVGLIATSGVDKTVRLCATDPQEDGEMVCATVGDHVTVLDWAITSRTVH